MITKTEKLRLGIFIVASLAMLGITILVLVGTRLMEPRDRYKIRFDESVSGLDVGAQVKLSGVRVGEVEDVRIDPQDLNIVVVMVSLRKGTPIRSDSEAVLRTFGITGLKFVEIRGGSGRGKLLEPGATIKAGQSVLGSLEGKAHDIAVKTEMAVTSVLDALKEKNLRNVEAILGHAERISGEMSGILEGNRDHIDTIVANFAEASNDVKAVAASARRSSRELELFVESSRPKFDRIVDNANMAAISIRHASQKLEKVDAVLTQIDRALREMNSQIESANVGAIAKSADRVLQETTMTLQSMRRITQASRLDLYRSVKSLRRSLHNLEQFSAEIRDNPSLLLSSGAPPERDMGE